MGHRFCVPAAALTTVGVLVFSAVAGTAPAVPTATTAPLPAQKLAPYAPTPQDVVERMLEVAQVTKADVVYDLGCGDGRLVITAAKKYGARGVGVDIDPERIAESRANAKKAGVESLVEFREQDALQVDVSPATVVTLYLLSTGNLKLRPIAAEAAAPGLAGGLPPVRDGRLGTDAHRDVHRLARREAHDLPLADRQVAGYAARMAFALHPQLRADTIAGHAPAAVVVRLMNDRTWPWLVLVPEREDWWSSSTSDAEERRLLIEEIALASTVLRGAVPARQAQRRGARQSGQPAACARDCASTSGSGVAATGLGRAGRRWPTESHERDKLVGALQDAFSAHRASVAALREAAAARDDGGGGFLSLLGFTDR